MAQTKAKTPARARRAATTKKAPAARARGAAKSRSREDRVRSAVSSTTDMSEGVLKSVEGAQRAAIDAVQKFVDTVDQALPSLGEGPSRRQEIVDSALEMADRLVHTQYDFLREVVDSAGKSLGESKRTK